MNKALIIVDLQNDFMPGGPLGVPCGHEVIPIANELQKIFDIIIASQDWHPANHGSFAVNHPEHKTGEIIQFHGLEQVLWPTHCVQNTDGAKLVDGLPTTKINKIIHKGTNPLIDSYSIFFDNARRQKTDLDDYLKSKSVSEIFLLGVATDYCVKFSALDGCYLDYKTYVIEDGCRGIDLHTGDVENAFVEMRKAGTKIIRSVELI
jgi:nicotinamidase/pyrazinamidase